MDSLFTSNTMSICPWQTNDLMALESAINQLSVSEDLINRRWAQKWFENFQFCLGNQNLKWSKKYDFAFDTDFMNQADSQGGNNKSKTNISRVVLEALSSHLFSAMPELDINSRYEESARTERLAKLLLGMKTAYDERLNLDEIFDMASVAFVMYSRIYLKASFNKTAGGTWKRPRQKVVMIPKMNTRQEIDPLTGQQIVVPYIVKDEAGEPIMVESYEDELDEMGNPILETVTTGDVDADVLTPFEVRRDSAAKTFSKIRYIQQIRIMDYDEFMVEFADQPGMIDERMSRIKGGTIAHPVMSLAIRHFLRTMYSSPPSLDYSGRSTTAPMMMLRNKVLVIEHYDKPSEGHKYNPTPWLKDGRRVVMANGFVVGISTPQYRTNKSDGWHPFTEIKWLPMPPSSESSGPMNDIVEKNRQINLTDAMMQLSVEKSSNSTLLLRHDSNLDEKKWTGMPGQVFTVTGDASTAASYVGDKSPLPPLVNQYRMQQKDEIYEISGAGDSLRGERSVGATSGYQAKLIEERERKRISKAKRNWERGIGGFYEKMFCCAQQNMIKFDRSVVAAVIRSSSGEVTQDDVIAFLNGPMDFGVDIKITPYSMDTKSKASQQATVQETVSNPAVAQKLATDPAMLDAYMEFMEMEPLRSTSAVHRDRAKKENSFFNDAARTRNPRVIADMAKNVPVVLWQDDDGIHHSEHTRDFVKNYDLYKNNAVLTQIIMAHMAMHEQNQRAKNQMQDPFVASTSADMAKRASEVANNRDPNTAPAEQRNFIQRQEDQMAAQMAGKKAVADMQQPDAQKGE